MSYDHQYLSYLNTGGEDDSEKKNKGSRTATTTIISWIATVAFAVLSVV